MYGSLVVGLPAENPQKPAFHNAPPRDKLCQIGLIPLDIMDGFQIIWK